MIVVHKQPLDMWRQCFLPAGRLIRFLDIQVQNDVPCLWYEVDLDTPPLPITIQVVGTGDGPDPRLSPHYITTTQSPPFVWHWYGAVGGNVD